MPLVPVLFSNVSDTNTITLQVVDSSSYDEIRQVSVKLLAMEIIMAKNFVCKQILSSILTYGGK